MKNRITKIAAVAVVIVTVSIVVNMLRGTPAWAIEQTVEALKEVKTIIVSGTTLYDDGTKSLPFKCWFKLDDKNGNLFLRCESEREFAIVRGDTVYFLKPGTNKVRIMEGARVKNLLFWYKMMELSPWLTGRILQTLKPLADEWHETYGRDEETGRDCVFVECSFKQFSASFWFAFDIETKLIVRGKHWTNMDRQGPPNMNATSLVYNQMIPDEMFEFEIPEGARVLDLKKVHKTVEEAQKDWGRAWDLFVRAKKLFDNKQYAEAIRVYEQVYKKYSYLDRAAIDALLMTGICYHNMAQYEKAIDTHKKAIEEYPNSKDFIVATYFYLGSSYLETGQKDKALEAFKNCVLVGKGTRDPDKSPIKDAQEYIEKLESETK